MTDTTQRTPPPEDERLAEAWRDHRQYVLDVAYRMLGSVTDAEDVVQETFARLLRAEDEIADVRGWLVVVATRLCLDQLRSARAKREAYVGPWLPEPVVESAGAPVDPADRITLDDSVRVAMLVVRSPEACRQLASRARRRIEEGTAPPRFHVDRAEVARLADRFIEAATNGDLDAL